VTKHQHVMTETTRPLFRLSISAGTQL